MLFLLPLSNIGFAVNDGLWLLRRIQFHLGLSFILGLQTLLVHVFVVNVHFNFLLRRVLLSILIKLSSHEAIKLISGSDGSWVHFWLTGISAVLFLSAVVTSDIILRELLRFSLKAFLPFNILLVFGFRVRLCFY